MKYRNLTIIGTSHISRESVNEITKYIHDNKPDFVAVELDKDRLNKLLSSGNGKSEKINYKAIKQVGIKGFLFAIFGAWASKKMGKMVGMTPGDDMKSAIITAAKNKLKIVLIDQHISITLKRISQKLTFKERRRFVYDIFMGLIRPKKQMEKYGIKKFDLKTVPQDKLIEKMLAQTKNRYPNFYSVLVEERNVVMGKRLIGLMIKHPDKEILVVIGAGHKEGMTNYIKTNFSIQKKKFEEHTKILEENKGGMKNKT